MPRTSGSRNRDYDAARHALAFAAAAHLLGSDGEPATFKDLAAAAGVSAPTLRHYFTDRDGVYEAALAAVLHESGNYLDELADPGCAHPEVSLPRLLLALVQAWRDYGLGRVFAASLALGLQHDRRGPTFLDRLLEPVLASAERMLSRHVERGELPPLDTRAAALSLVSPIVLALLHQDHLGGQRCRQLDIDQYVHTHARTLLHGLSPARPGLVA